MEATIEQILSNKQAYKVCVNDNVLNRQENEKCQYCDGVVFYPNGEFVEKEVYVQMEVWTEFYKPEIFKKILLKV